MSPPSLHFSVHSQQIRLSMPHLLTTTKSKQAKQPNLVTWSVCLSDCLLINQSLPVFLCLSIFSPFSHIISLSMSLPALPQEHCEDLGLLSSSTHLHPFILFPPLILLLLTPFYPFSSLSLSLPPPCLTCFLSPKNKPTHTSKHTHIHTHTNTHTHTLTHYTLCTRIQSQAQTHLQPAAQHLILMLGLGEGDLAIIALCPTLHFPFSSLIISSIL